MMSDTELHIPVLIKDPEKGCISHISHHLRGASLKSFTPAGTSITNMPETINSSQPSSLGAALAHHWGKRESDARSNVMTTVFLSGTNINENWLRASAQVEWVLEALACKSAATAAQSQSGTSQIKSMCCAALNDTSMIDLLVPNACKVRRLGECTATEVNTEAEVLQLLDTVGARVEGRDAIKKSIGVLQLVCNVMNEAAAEIEPQTHVWRFVFVPPRVTNTTCGKLLAGVLRTAAVLREASELLRQKSNLSLPSWNVLVERKPACVASSFAELRTSKITFHLPARDSTLVQILLPSLLGQSQSRLAMVVAGSPARLGSCLVKLMADLILLRPTASFADTSNSSIALYLPNIALKASICAVCPVKLLNKLLPPDGVQEQRGAAASPSTTTTHPSPRKSEHTGQLFQQNSILLKEPPLRNRFSGAHTGIRESPTGSSTFSSSLQNASQRSQRGLFSGRSSLKTAMQACLSPSDVRSVRKALVSAAEEAHESLLSTSHSPQWLEKERRDEHEQRWAALTFSSEARLQAAARKAVSAAGGSS